MDTYKVTNKFLEYLQIEFTRLDIADYFGLSYYEINKMLSLLLRKECIIKQEDKNGSSK